MSTDARPDCPAAHHDTVSAAKKHHCRCPKARAARNAQRRRQYANRRDGTTPGGLDPDLRRTLTIQRIARGMTQRDVAQAIGVNCRTVGSWETGGLTPLPANLAAWLEALGCEVAP